MFWGQLESQTLQLQSSSTKQLITTEGGTLGWRWGNFCLRRGAGLSSRKVPSFRHNTFKALFPFLFPSQVIASLTGEGSEWLDLPSNSPENHGCWWGRWKLYVIRLFDCSIKEQIQWNKSYTRAWKMEASPFHNFTSWWSEIHYEVRDCGVAIYPAPLLFSSVYSLSAGKFDFIVNWNFGSIFASKPSEALGLFEMLVLCCSMFWV